MQYEKDVLEYGGVLFFGEPSLLERRKKIFNSGFFFVKPQDSILY